MSIKNGVIKKTVCRPTDTLSRLRIQYNKEKFRILKECGFINEFASGEEMLELLINNDIPQNVRNDITIDYDAPLTNLEFKKSGDCFGTRYYILKSKYGVVIHNEVSLFSPSRYSNVSIIESSKEYNCVWGVRDIDAINPKYIPEVCELLQAASVKSEEIEKENESKSGPGIPFGYGYRRESNIVEITKKLYQLDVDYISPGLITNEKMYEAMLWLDGFKSISNSPNEYTTANPSDSVKRNGILVEKHINGRHYFLNNNFGFGFLVCDGQDRVLSIERDVYGSWDISKSHTHNENFWWRRKEVELWNHFEKSIQSVICSGAEDCCESTGG